MSRRGLSWPPGARWLAAGIAAVVLALAVAWVLFVPVADWLAHHDVGSLTGSLHETALDNARGRLLTLGAGLFAAGALAFTARNFTLSREGQVTDRYTKAIEQLGSDKLDIRIGGIYALERVARDSARDHPTVMEVLTAFIREHSREEWMSPNPYSQKQEQTTRPDVQAALTVIGRRDVKRDIRRIRLMYVDLTRADLTNANLAGQLLFRANLTGASLADANLAGANLEQVNLTGAYTSGASLPNAKLDLANLTGANLIGANLAGASLIGANFTGASLALANLTGANLTKVRWPPDAPVPQGWILDTASERLTRAGTDPDSGSPETNLSFLPS